MYFYLISALKRRLILELQQSFQGHPVYSKIVPYIQNKFVFEERPQYGIVVKGSSTNKVQLSGDNFLGTILSHVMLANFVEPAYPLEWVREDLKAIEVNGGLATLPGIYYLECTRAPTNAQEPGEFVIDPLLTVTDEPVLQFQSGIEREAQLERVPNVGTVRLWENRNHLLKEGKDYTVDYNTGGLTLLGRYYPRTTLTADYRYAAPTIGPIPFYWNTVDFSTLPGIVLAFGKRARTNDKVAVVVYGERTDTARAFGGKNEVTFELDVISQDSTQMEEIADLALMYLWAVKKPLLESEGIELLDVSIGGEAEEAYDETADMPFYTASLTVQFRADWEIHVPLPLTISKSTAVSAATEDGTDEERRADANSSIQIIPASNLFYPTSPVLKGRNADFERIT